MNASEPIDVLNDSVVELLLSVARRADQLSQQDGYGRAADRRAWLRAELEVFERIETARPRAVLTPA